MKYYESECVECPPEIGCPGAGCPYYKVEHFKCDWCGEEDVRLYDYNGYEICETCLLKEFDIVEGSDW